MKKVTMVIDEEQDIVLWYLDGICVGHDDQIDHRELVEWLGGEVIHADLSSQRPDLLSEMVR